MPFKEIPRKSGKGHAGEISRERDDDNLSPIFSSMDTRVVTNGHKPGSSNSAPSELDLGSVQGNVDFCGSTLSPPIKNACESSTVPLVKSDAVESMPHRRNLMYAELSYTLATYLGGGFDDKEKIATSRNTLPEVSSDFHLSHTQDSSKPDAVMLLPDATKLSPFFSIKKKPSAPLSYLKGNFFSLYLTRSSLERLENHDDKISEGLLSSSSRRGNEERSEDSVDDDHLSFTHFSMELRAYIQKMNSYVNQLRDMLSDEKSTFTQSEIAEMKKHLEDITGVVKEISTAFHDAQLNAYIAAAKVLTERVKLSEQRLIRLTQEKEAAVDLRRSACLQVSRELQQERAAVKSILLHSSCRRNHSRKAASKFNEPLDFESDVELSLGGAEWDLDVDGDFSPPPETEKDEGDSSLEFHEIDTDSPLTAPFPVNSCIATRRQWICDNAAGYFLDCKDSVSQECVCAMMARMQPHEMANNVLQYQKQMSIVSNRLISRCPGALAFHSSLVEEQVKALHQQWDVLERQCVSEKGLLFSNHIQFLLPSSA